MRAAPTSQVRLMARSLGVRLPPAMASITCPIMRGGIKLKTLTKDKARIPDWDADSLFSASLGERLGYHTEREYKVYQIAVE